jgi:hypothetical protein
MALAISFAFFIGATLAESLAIWPLPTNEFTTTTGREITSGTAFWYADVVFVILLLFGHNLTRFCRSEPIVFLDKCCIDQSDREKKEEGIRSLDVFLSSSERMALMFSEDYFDRLWCAYEIAIFLRRKSVKNVDFCCTALYPAVLKIHVAMMFVCSYILASRTILEVDGVWTIYVLAALIFIISDFLADMLAKISRSRKVVSHQLRNFALAKTSCFCCSVDHTLPDGTRISCDRELVYDHVCQLYNTLEQFDESVHGPFNASVQALMGQAIFRMPVSCYLISFWPIFLDGTEMALLTATKNSDYTVKKLFQASNVIPLFCCLTMIFDNIAECCRLYSIKGTLGRALRAFLCFVVFLAYVPWDHFSRFLPLPQAVALACAPSIACGIAAVKDSWRGESITPHQAGSPLQHWSRRLRLRPLGMKFDFSGQDSGANTQHKTSSQFGFTRQRKTTKTIYLKEKRDVVALEESADPTSFRPEESPEVGTEGNGENCDIYVCVFKAILYLCICDLCIQIVRHVSVYLYN